MSSNGSFEGAEIFEQYESNVRLYSRVFPTVFDRARNAELFDVKGRRFVDFFAGSGALNYGHNPQRIRQQLVQYLLDERVVHALDAHTVEKARFIRRFVDVVLQPRNLDYKIQFCGPTGTNAVEAALKLARKITGRTNVIAFHGGYHGMSMGSASVTGSLGVRRAFGVPLANTTFFPFEDGPQGKFDSLGLIRRTLADACSGTEKPAAIILECFQMDGGIYPASAEFLRDLRALCDETGAMLIADEIQVGCGRTGDFFSFEKAGIVPDFVTVSKSIGGYGLPMSLLLMKRSHDAWKPGEHTGTFRGHQLSFVAAAAALDFWQDDSFRASMEQNTQFLQVQMRQALESLHPKLQVRGRGMALGADVEHIGGPEMALRVQKRCFDAGLIIERCGREDTVLKLLPPLTIERPHLEEGCRALLQSLKHELPAT